MARFLSTISLLLVVSSVLSYEIAKQNGSHDENDVICPDGQSACPDGNTCCLLSTGEYGCCPLPNAVCCPDQIHCCPNGYSCNYDSCIRGQHSIPWVKKEKAKNVTSSNSVRCDAFSTCPDRTTCCKTISGQWGCCPIPNAVCCKDGLHCCPSGTICDAAHSRCLKREGLRIGEEFTAKVHLVTKTKEETYTVKVCPDKKSYCPDGSTCCLLSGGSYGCCPYRRATCCIDHIHCCPEGSSCDLLHSRCNSHKASDDGKNLVPLSTKSPALTWNAASSSDFCRDEETACLHGRKCCITVKGEWGCCAF